MEFLFQEQDGRGRLAAAEQAMQGLNIGPAGAGPGQPPSIDSKDSKVGGINHHHHHAVANHHGGDPNKAKKLNNRVV